MNRFRPAAVVNCVAVVALVADAAAAVGGAECSIDEAVAADEGSERFESFGFCFVFFSGNLRVAEASVQRGALLVVGVDEAVIGVATPI